MLSFSRGGYVMKWIVFVFTIAFIACVESTKVIVTITDPLPARVNNYIYGNDTSAIIEMHFFNKTNRLLLVVEDWCPLLESISNETNLDQESSSSGTQSNTMIEESVDSSPTTTLPIIPKKNRQKFLVSENTKVSISIGKPTPVISPIHIDPDILTNIQDENSTISVSWALQRIDTRETPLSGTYLGYSSTSSKQRGSNIYVLDTGIWSHVDFPISVNYDFNFYPSDPVTDCNGHGTHVSGLIISNHFGVDPNPLNTIHSIKILNCFGSGTTAGVAAGLLYVLDNYVAPAIINLSVGMGTTPDSTIIALIQEAIDADISVIAAAGNQADDACHYYPSAISGVISVGATLEPTGAGADVVASYSNFGSCVSIYAPGDSVESTLPNNLYGFKSGTSMACPLVVGAVTLALGTFSSLTAPQATTYILNQATPHIVAPSLASTSSVNNNLLYVSPAATPAPAPAPTTPSPPPTVATSTNSATTTASASTTQSAVTTTTSAASTTASSFTTTLGVTTLNSASQASSVSTTLLSVVTTAAAAASVTVSQATSTSAATTVNAVAITRVVTTNAASTTASATTNALVNANSASTTILASTTRAATTSNTAASTLTSSQAASTASTTVSATSASTSTSAASTTTKATTTAASSTTRASTSIVSVSTATSRASTTLATILSAISTSSVSSSSSSSASTLHVSIGLLSWAILPTILMTTLQIY